MSKPAPIYEANRMRVEIAGPHAMASWSPDFHGRVNYADEDLMLRVFRDGELAQTFRVNHLRAKEFAVSPGNYRLELARVFRREVEVRTTLDQVPGVVWLSDSPASHVVMWLGMDWPFLQREVERLHHLDWAREVEVAVRLVVGGEVRWIPVPERDHITLHDRVDQLELCVRRPDASEPLKTLFLARRPPPDVRQVFAAVEFPVAARPAYLSLRREVIETDTLQLRVDWDVPDKESLRLVLEHEGREFRPHEERKVGSRGDWYFYGLEPGEYRAKLFSGRSKKPALESNPMHLPARPTRAVLMPISEKGLYCYWHLESSVWRELAEKHGDLLGRVRCQLKVYHEWGGGLWHQPHLDREVDLNSARDYWLEVPPDRVYRVQLLAWIDGWKAESLTDLSNPAQTGRTQAGTNPIQHLHVEQKLSHPTIRPLAGPTAVSSYSVGYLMLHLHAHLPFIPDPVDFTAGEQWRPQGYPQEWFPEAVRETYLPLLEMMETLVAEGVDFRLSMDISPPLAAMMKSPRHQADVATYLERLIRLARVEYARTSREEPHYTTAAHMHLRQLARCRDLFLGYDCDLTAAFRHFQELGKLEICTCVGTHPMLPLWTTVPNAIRGQCAAAADYHQQVFGRPSVGVWLPECAYAPGIERYLEEAGFRYFFSEGVTLLQADAPTEFGLNAPVYVKASQVTMFPRDPETSEQVWSGEMGYPGDPDYLEFHIRGGAFKYNRITDRKSGYKEPYNPDWARAKAASHAEHFIHCRNARFAWLRPRMWKKPLIAAPYDAELFGHHWYEGPQFLYFLFKKLHYDQNVTELITPTAYLAANPTAQEVWPDVSSWGDKGTFEKWMTGATAWMYRHGHEAAEEMGRMAATRPEGEARRILTQAGRQLTLAMSSDLPFVISNGHFVDRMKDLFFGALRDFWRLSEMFWEAREGREVDLEFVRHLELVNCVFPQLNPDHFR